VVVNCAGGYRSLVAASLLRHVGFGDVSDLIGGYGAWSKAGLPIAGRRSTPMPAIEVTTIAAQDLIVTGAEVIDVRELDEWTAGHAPQAQLIPMSKVESQIDSLRDLNSAVVVCRSGGRSKAVTQMLNSHGINAVNLAGGMQAWASAGLPVVTSAGDPGQII
jgi:rhodanese-related sulfurtransferase